MCAYIDKWGKQHVFCEMWDLNFTLWIVFFHEQFAKKQHVQDSFLRKSCFPKNVFAKILGNQDLGMRKIWVRSFSKDVPCLYVILKYIHNVCICDVAILYMMTGNHLFFCEKLVFSKMLATSRSDWSQNGSWITSMLNPLFAKNQGLVLLKQLLVP